MNLMIFPIKRISLVLGLLISMGIRQVGIPVTFAIDRISVASNNVRVSYHSGKPNIPISGHYEAQSSGTNDPFLDNTKHEGQILIYNHWGGLGAELTRRNYELNIRDYQNDVIAFVGQDWNVWLMQSDGSDIRQLTFDAKEGEGVFSPEVGYRQLRWSPNGELLGAVRHNQDGDSIVVFSILDSGMNYLVMGIEGSYDWLPNSKAIVFADAPYDPLRRGSYPGGLSSINLETGQVTSIIEPPSNQRLINPDCSPNGDYILFTIELSPWPDVIWAPILGLSDLSGSTYVEVEEVISPTCDWSPSSEEVVCGNNIMEFASSQLLILSPLGVELGRIPKASSQDIVRSPAWSPNGRFVVYERYTSYPDYETFLTIAEMEGWEVVSIKMVEGSYTPLNWASDSNGLLVLSEPYGNDSKLVFINIDTLHTTELTPGFWGACQPHPSLVPGPTPTIEPGDQCGIWEWAGPAEEKDQRIVATKITSESREGCRGAFRLSNETDVYGFGGYTLEMQAYPENASVIWPRTFSYDPQEVPYLLPTLDIELHGIPTNPSSDAYIRAQGDMTFGSFVVDVSLFLLRTGLALVPGSGCLIPEEQLLFTALRVSDIVSTTASLSLSGDFVGAKEELSQVLDEFYQRAGETLASIGVECAVDLFGSILKKPLAIVKIGIAYLTWVPIAIFDYFKYQGQPAEIIFEYTQ